MRGSVKHTAGVVAFHSAADSRRALPLSGITWAIASVCCVCRCCRSVPVDVGGRRVSLLWSHSALLPGQSELLSARW